MGIYQPQISPSSVPAEITNFFSVKSEALPSNHGSLGWRHRAPHAPALGNGVEAHRIWMKDCLFTGNPSIDLMDFHGMKNDGGKKNIVVCSV